MVRCRRTFETRIPVGAVRQAVWATGCLGRVSFRIGVFSQLVMGREWVGTNACWYRSKKRGGFIFSWSILLKVKPAAWEVVS